MARTPWAIGEPLGYAMEGKISAMTYLQSLTPAAYEREAERLRESEAARLGASGVVGSGDFDSRVAQINTDTGEAIASNLADLTNKRRAEMLTTAMSGANMQMSDLERQARAKQAEYGSRVDREKLALAARDAQRADRQRLLEVLMAQDTSRPLHAERAHERAGMTAEQRWRDEIERRENDRRFERERQLGDNERRMREEMMRLELEQKQRAAPKPYVPYNPHGYDPYRGW